MTGWVTEEESDWSTADLQSALDWQAEQDALCPGCHSPSYETMVHEEDAPVYDVVSLVCWRCRAKGLAAESAAESNGGRSPVGRYYLANPRN